MKKLLTLVLALALVMSMTAFATADEAAKITVFHYMVEGNKAAGLEEVEKAFQAAHPELNVEFENIAYSQGSDYWPQLETAIAAGDNPEIIMGNPGLYASLIDEGFIKNLTGNAVIQNLGLTAGDMGDVSYKGEWYAYPVDFKSWGVFYNTKIFADLGIEIPKTHTELLAVCQKLQDNGITPWAQWYADGASVDIEMRPIVWTKALQNGDKDMFEKLMSGEKKIADYPYFAEGLKVWGERMTGWARPDATSNKQTDANEVFISGQAAMLYQGTWNIGTIEDSIAGTDFEYGFFLCPTDDTGSNPVLNVQVDQAFMEETVLDRILERWLREWSLVNRVKVDECDCGHVWFWDGHEHVDPSKEATAQEKRLANNTTTLAAEYAKQGKDWETELRQRAKEKSLMDELGLSAPDAAPAQNGKEDDEDNE